MKIPVWLLTSDDDSSGRQVEAYGSEAAANNAAAALVATMAEQEKLVREVEADNWCGVLSELQVRPGFNNFLWLDQVEVEMEFGPLAITIEGGAQGFAIAQVRSDRFSAGAIELSADPTEPTIVPDDAEMNTD